MKIVRVCLLSVAAALSVAGLFASDRISPTYSELWEWSDLVVIVDIDRAKLKPCSGGASINEHYGRRSHEWQCTVELVLKGICPSNSISVDRECYYLDRPWFDKMREAEARGDSEAKHQLAVMNDDLRRFHSPIELYDGTGDYHENSYLLFLSRSDNKYYSIGLGWPKPLPKPKDDRAAGIDGVYEGSIYIQGLPFDDPSQNAIRTPIRILVKRAGVHRAACTITFFGQKRFETIPLPDMIQSGVFRIDEGFVHHWQTDTEKYELRILDPSFFKGERERHELWGSLTKFSTWPDGSWGPTLLLQMRASRKDADER